MTLSEFVPLGPRISLYTPAKPAKGQLIIICTWLGAAPKHVAKYTAVYQRIAPGARILLVQSAVPILVSSYARQRAAIIPAVSTVLGTLAECSHPSIVGDKDTANEDAVAGNGLTSSTSSENKPAPKIILHMFSNGGTNSATQFFIVLNERLRSPLPLSGMLYDSCPAKGTYWKDHRAMVYSLPKDIITRTLGTIIVHIILLMLHTEIACGLENPSSLLRRTLLDGSKLIGAVEPSTGEAATSGEGRSCYLYSKSDQMVDWTDIKDHAAEARSKGWQAEEVMFEGSAHCGHFQKDAEKYTKAMERMWQGSPDASKVTAKL
ncbi:hypothetical protein MMC34_000007 [Xylographa carneopallida]|nr:hypothetical protein [Xylographa carneopallida]